MLDVNKSKNLQTFRGDLKKSKVNYMQGFVDVKQSKLSKVVSLSVGCPTTRKIHELTTYHHGSSS